MLTRANLLRIRSQWQEAADLCMEVLRLDPENDSAHSLLGDIYLEQGRPDEARHWYQFALEMNPRSAADKAKLARVDQMLESRRQRVEWEAVVEGKNQPLTTALLIRESVQRVGALAGGAVCGIILVMAVLVSLSERSPYAAGEAAAVPAVLFPRSATRLASETRREREVLRRVTELGAGGVGQALRVELEPQSRSASLRLYMPRSVRERMSPTEFRLTLMRDGYRFARALVTEESGVGSVQVNVVGPAPAFGGEDVELLLGGVLSQADLTVPAERLTAAELQAHYSAVSAPVWAAELGGG